MQALRATIAVVALLATALAAVGRPQPAPAGGLDGVARQVAALDHAQQERYVARLFADRSQPACRACMSPAELAAQLRRQAAILAHLRSGRELSVSGVGRLLKEVDQQEQRAIEALSRELLSGAFQQFLHDRAEFERRADQLRRAAQALDRGQNRWQTQEQFLAWLRTAVARQRQSPQRDWPVLPLALDEPLARTKPQRKPEPAYAGVTHAAVSPRVDTNEFSARVTGYNLAVSELISQLHTPEPWNATRLDVVVGKLADLALIRTDLTLYWNVLPASARRAMKPIASLDPVVSLVGAQTAAARRRLEAAGSVEGPEVLTELRGLDRISRRLAQLATSLR